MPATLLIPTRAPQLTVRRTDIAFRNVAPGRVRISVRVHNAGDAASEPTRMHLQAAPLGAFVAWEDLTSLDVPSIGAESFVEVSTEVAAPIPPRTREGAQVPPGRLFTAVADGDEQPHRAENAPGGARNLLDRASPRRKTLELPANPFELLGRPGVHWAGNINVLIGDQAVERHMAQALRIYPGRMNLAMFFVGDGRDMFQFDLQGSGADWDAALFECTRFHTLLSDRGRTKSIPLAEWVAFHRMSMLLLAVTPPADCEAGSVEVHVRQRSTGRDVVVEFSLDPRAAGAGCYTV